MHLFTLEVLEVFSQLVTTAGVTWSKRQAPIRHALYQINVTNIEELEIINKLINHLYLDEWSRAVPGRPGHILVPKESKDVFEISLNAGGLKYEVKFHNIRELLNLEDQRLKDAASRNKRQKSQREGYEIFFNMVYTYTEINNYLDYLAITYPFVENVNGGKSVENRPIQYLKISTTKFEDTKKPIIMLQSLIHAREWITIPVALYVIHNLVQNITEPELFTKIDWIIIPVVNPDGYVYTHETDRMWRKNRRPAICTGVDLNRNFQHLWGTYSSSFSCSDNFHGERPLSEPETRVIDEIITIYNDRIALYLDLHSYGSMILYPYGDGTLSQYHYTIHEVGVMMGKTIDQIKLPLNPKYVVGNIANVLYTVSGCACDHAHSFDIPLSYTFELPEGDGFLVDNSTIEPICYETWQAISAGAKYIILNKHNITG